MNQLSHSPSSIPNSSPSSSPSSGPLPDSTTDPWRDDDVTATPSPSPAYEEDAFDYRDQGTIKDPYKLLSQQNKQHKKDNEYLKKLLEDTWKKIDFITNQLDEFKKKSVNFEERMQGIQREMRDEFEKKVENAKNQATWTLGVFVTLFTFISIDVAILKDVSNLGYATSLILILAGVLILFVGILGDTLKQKESQWKTYLSAVIFLIIGFGFMIYTIRNEGTRACYVEKNKETVQDIICEENPLFP